MKILIALLALLIGALTPFQALINAKLSQNVGHPVYAAFFSFLGGVLIFSFISFFCPVEFPAVKKLVNLPWILFSGGIIGAIFVFSAIILVPKLGTTAWLALIFTGQLVISIVLDHFGLLGLPVREVSFQKVVGGLLLGLGSFLALKN